MSNSNWSQLFTMANSDNKPRTNAIESQFYTIHQLDDGTFICIGRGGPTMVPVAVQITADGKLLDLSLGPVLEAIDFEYTYHSSCTDGKKVYFCTQTNHEIGANRESSAHAAVSVYDPSLPKSKRLHPIYIDKKNYLSNFNGITYNKTQAGTPALFVAGNATKTLGESKSHAILYIMSLEGKILSSHEAEKDTSYTSICNGQEPNTFFVAGIKYDSEIEGVGVPFLVKVVNMKFGRRIFPGADVPSGRYYTVVVSDTYVLAFGSYGNTTLIPNGQTKGIMVAYDTMSEKLSIQTTKNIGEILFGAVRDPQTDFVHVVGGVPGTGPCNHYMVQAALSSTLYGPDQVDPTGALHALRGVTVDQSGRLFAVGRKSFSSDLFEGEAGVVFTTARGLTKEDFLLEDTKKVAKSHPVLASLIFIVFMLLLALGIYQMVKRSNSKRTATLLFV